MIQRYALMDIGTPNGNAPFNELVPFEPYPSMDPACEFHWCSARDVAALEKRAAELEGRCRAYSDKVARLEASNLALAEMAKSNAVRVGELEGQLEERKAAADAVAIALQDALTERNALRALLESKS